MNSRDSRGDPGLAAIVRGALIGFFLAAGWCDPTARAEDKDQTPVEFFEKSVRPILSARCLGCHGPEKHKGGLRLDSRQGLMAGGTSGPAVVPGNPDESALVDAVNYGEAYQMPPKSKLPAHEIATLTDWVKRGAPWGFDTTASEGKAAAPGDRLSAAEFQERAKFWCFQPIKPARPPRSSPARAGWARNPIDAFLLAAMNDHGLEPAPEADRRVLARRLAFDLLGLPPDPELVAAFLADPAPDAYEKLVERLLASPHFGERQGRHWLDLVRYAETSGHEFDYDIPGAWAYRDYVVRALNADVPFDRFTTEHLAGDLLAEPRRRPGTGSNESILATAFFFLGEGTHSPVDVREEEMRRIDNQIDVISKTFLGLTLACARCHDHKFDPIRTNDYYAMAGFLRGTRIQHAVIDAPERRKSAIERIRSLNQAVVDCALEARGARIEPSRRGLGREYGELFEDFSRPSYEGWFISGDAFGDRPSQAGDARLAWDAPGPRLVAVEPGIAHSGLVADGLAGAIRSRSFIITKRYVHARVMGRGGRVAAIVDNFEKIRDPIYGGLARGVEHGDQWRWLTLDLEMWKGQTAYLEIADGTVADFNGANTRLEGGQGYVAVDEIRFSDVPVPSAETERTPSRPPVDLQAVVTALESSDPARARALAGALAQARTAHAQLARPTLALAAADGTGLDEHVHIRGSYRTLGELVPRRFLQILGGLEPTTRDSALGRLDLARRMVDPAANPLLARVLVNRIWRQHFGEGLVASPDDFGAMGRKPSHPELLDWLASELVASGWSMKHLHRLMVSSSAYRMASTPVERFERLDPGNVYLHRMNPRRLEAEAIRDTILSVSGRLDPAMEGPSVPVHLTPFMEGRGRPAASGPLDGGGRRTLYLAVRRNFLDPFLLAFDMPVPFATMGRRNRSNVPAQALALMNDPFVASASRKWADRALESPPRSDRTRLDRLYQTAFARPATNDEAQAALAFLASRAQAGAAVREGWADLCHVLMNTKEFLFIE